MTRTMIALTLLLAGCASVDRLELDARWLPLEELREGDVPFVPDTAATTIGAAVYVGDLEDFLARHPAGSPELEAVLAHEQVHAQRQLEDGVEAWLVRYVVDRDFARDEELLGWRVQILHERATGRGRTAEFYAGALARYRNGDGRLISYADALAFARGVLTEP